MFIEKDFEDIICKYPELIGNGLTLKGRQVTLYGRRMDILFEDKFKIKLIIELKKGPILIEHVGQIMEYEGILLSADDPTIRIMLIGNRVPPNIRRSLDHHGIAWKEITERQLLEFLKSKGNQEDEEIIKKLEEMIITIPDSVKKSEKSKKPDPYTEDSPIEPMGEEEFDKLFANAVISKKDLNEMQSDPKPVAILDYKKQGKFIHAFLLFHIVDPINVNKWNDSFLSRASEYFGAWFYASTEGITQENPLTFHINWKMDRGFLLSRAQIEKLVTAIKK